MQANLNAHEPVIAQESKGPWGCESDDLGYLEYIHWKCPTAVQNDLLRVAAGSGSLWCLEYLYEFFVVTYYDSVVEAFDSWSVEGIRSCSELCKHHLQPEDWEMMLKKAMSSQRQDVFRAVIDAGYENQPMVRHPVLWALKWKDLAFARLADAASHTRVPKFSLDTADAARHSIDMLMFVISLGGELTEDAVLCLVYGGQLELLKYAHSLHVPWHEDTLEAALWCDQVEVLRYVYRAGCPMVAGVRGSHFRCAKSLEVLRFVLGHIFWSCEIGHVLVAKEILRATEADLMRELSCWQS